MFVTHLHYIAQINIYSNDSDNQNLAQCSTPPHSVTYNTGSTPHCSLGQYITDYHTVASVGGSYYHNNNIYRNGQAACSGTAGAEVITNVQ